jgi:hypothetical protein
MEEYIAKVKTFKNGKVKMREYKRKMTVPKKHKAKAEASTEKKKKDVGKIKARSLSRTRTSLIELVENNEDAFISFITLTYKDEVEDIDRAYTDLSNYLKLCKRHLKKEGKELQYIAVPEIQRKRATKTGKYVIHFHLITNIEIGSVLIPKRPAKTIEGADHKGTKTIEYYDLKGWSKGFSIAMPIQHQGEFELSQYLLKYLYKDFSDRFFGRQKILHSNNLKVPDFEYYLEEDTIENIKRENHSNLSEVFSMSEYETENPFIDYVYKKPVD